MFCQGLRAWSRVAAGFVLPGSLMRGLDPLSSSQSVTAALGGTGSQSASLLSKSTVLQLRTVLWPVALWPVICERRGRSRLLLPCRSYRWSFHLGDWSLFSFSNHYGCKHSTALCDGWPMLSLLPTLLLCTLWATPSVGWVWSGLWGQGSCARRANIRDLGIVFKHSLREHRTPTSHLSWTRYVPRLVWVKFFRCSMIKGYQICLYGWGILCGSPMSRKVLGNSVHTQNPASFYLGPAIYKDLC